MLGHSPPYPNFIMTRDAHIKYSLVLQKLHFVNFGNLVLNPQTRVELDFHKYRHYKIPFEMLAIFSLYAQVVPSIIFWFQTL